ncbi:hypothetical protein ACFP3I_25485 [Chryseobacterium arachidis]|uniref:hypothetical protein n=1 Tax=Chryseobacterium arachidis TaxID=1416778 RepID=UPI003605D24C
MWYYSKLFSVNREEIFNDPNFWISSGLLLWSCSGFLDVYRCIICTTMIKSFLTSFKVILM